MTKTHKLFVISIILIMFANPVFAQKKYNYTPAKNADQMIKNLQTFYDEIYIHLSRFSELEPYRDVADKLEAEIDKYEDRLTPAEKKRFDALIAKVDTKKDSIIDDTPQNTEDYPIEEDTVVEESDIIDSTANVMHIYGPAHSEEDYLDKIENIYNEVVAPATSLAYLETYQEDFNLIESEKDRFYGTFTKQQKERYTNLISKMESKENSLRSGINPSKYANAKNAGEAIANLKEFLDTVFFSAEDDDLYNIMTAYDNDMNTISSELEKYASDFTEEQIDTLENLSKEVRAKQEKYYISQAKKNLPESKYGPSDSPEKFLTNLELFYKEVLIPLSGKKDVLVPASYYEYNSIFSFDRELYIDKFNEKQLKQFETLTDKINEKEIETFGYTILAIQFIPPIISEDDGEVADSIAAVDEYDGIGIAYQDYDAAVDSVAYATQKAKMCSICSNSAEDLLDNLKTFYDDYFSSFTDLDTALDFVSEMQDLQESINEYESGFTAEQKNEFDTIIKKYRQKAEHLGLISYPQSFSNR
ncbi:MAG: hypothetical protein ACK5MK_09070 [Dysgonomonas sp.]